MDKRTTADPFLRRLIEGLAAIYGTNAHAVSEGLVADGMWLTTMYLEGESKSDLVEYVERCRTFIAD